MQQASLFDSSPAPTLPIRGTTAIARTASQSGARQAVKTYSEKVSRILQLLRNEPLSRQQLSEITGIRINSVCSLLASQITQGRVESNGDFHIQQWPDGSVTKQERFRIRRTR